MRIAIFGANGRTGQLVTRHALDAGHDVVAAARRPDGFPLADPRLTVRRSDVRETSTLDPVVAGADAVVLILGTPMTLGGIDIYSTGASAVVDAMHTAGARRLVAVSSSAVTTYPGRTGTPLSLAFFEPALKWTIGRTTYADQRRMEALIADSDLDWTVVRPSGLFDLPDVTEYVAGQVDPVGAFTSRNDLADYLVRLAESSGPNASVTVSTVTDTPSMWEMIRREAFASA
jgi:uncharacterized protein YbjT (DUF2867 family)